MNCSVIQLEICEGYIELALLSKFDKKEYSECCNEEHVEEIE